MLVLLMIANSSAILNVFFDPENSAFFPCTPPVFGSLSPTVGQPILFSLGAAVGIHDTGLAGESAKERIQIGL